MDVCFLWRKEILRVIPTMAFQGIYSDMYFDIYSDIRPNILSDIYSDILFFLALIIWHLFWHSIWHSPWHSLLAFSLFGPKRSPLRSELAQAQPTVSGARDMRFGDELAQKWTREAEGREEFRALVQTPTTGPAGNTLIRSSRCLRRRSGGEHSDPQLAVEARRGSLWSRGCCSDPAGNTAI